MIVINEIPRRHIENTNRKKSHMREGVTRYKGWKIYSSSTGEYGYAAFLPGDSPINSDPEWEADNINEIKDFIDSYED